VQQGKSTDTDIKRLSVQTVKTLLSVKAVVTEVEKTSVNSESKVNTAFHLQRSRGLHFSKRYTFILSAVGLNWERKSWQNQESAKVLHVNLLRKLIHSGVYSTHHFGGLVAQVWPSLQISDWWLKAWPSRPVQTLWQQTADLLRLVAQSVAQPSWTTRYTATVTCCHIASQQDG